MIGVKYFVLLALWLSTPALDIVKADRAYSNYYPIIGIRINGGAEYTNSTQITVEVKSLKIKENLVAFMQIGADPEFRNSDWLPYSKAKQKFQLPEGDGEKFVYVRLKDKQNNISPIEQEKIFLDTSPPQNASLSINQNAPYTNDQNMRVMLQIKVEQATKMKISNDSQFNEIDWEPVKPEKKWILAPAGDGTKSVFAIFSDQAGNTSKMVSDDIILDTKPPEKTSLVINNDNSYTISNTVELSIKAQDAQKVRLLDNERKAEVIDFVGNDQNQMTVEWSFSERNGIKMVRAYFLDQAGNYSKEPAQDEIILDNQPPVPPKIVIENDQEHINHPDGKISFKLLGNGSEEKVYFKVSNNHGMEDSQYMLVSPNSQDWQLDNREDGQKTVYFRFKDIAGNETKPVEKKINLDRSPPKVIKFSINGDEDITNNPLVSLAWEVNEKSSFQISNTKNFTEEKWYPYRDSIANYQLTLENGKKELFVRFKDQAENISQVSKASIILDTKPPQGSLSINKSEKYTNKPAVSLDIDTGDAIKMQLANEMLKEKTEWQNPQDKLTEWTLDESTDGIKSIYLRLMDKAGNVSDPIKSSIILDRQPPSNCNLLINNGSEWFNRIDYRVTLLFQAKGASEIMVSNDPTFAGGKWIEAQTTLGWNLKDGGDGLKTAFAKFRDQAGNESKAVQASIKVDTKAPSVKTFEIDRNNDFTGRKDRKVQLSILADEADSMLISNEEISDPENPKLQWFEYQPEFEWQLKDEDGVVTVFIYLKDKAGNISGNAKDHIILDRIPPEGGRIFINNNQRATNNPQVMLRLIAKDAEKMRIGNTANLDSIPWIKHASTYNWSLPADTDGRKRIHASFMDKAGNISQAVYDDIILDRIPPNSASVSYVLDSTSEGHYKLKMQIKIDEASHMMFGDTSSFTDTEWEEFSAEKEISVDSAELAEFPKLYYFKYRDDAGNVSEVIEKQIIIK